MRVLVTGASGFVGRHLVEALRGAGDAVVELSGDVRDPASYEGLPRVDVVHHLAARASVPESVQDPWSTWDVNANGTLRLLEWARASGSGRVVLVSSAHVYGRAERSPIDESHPIRPVTPYGASKAAAESIARAYAASYGIETVIVRPFNIYGPGQPTGYVVPDVLRQLRAGKELVLGDPRPVRDFTFVSDAVEMLRTAGAAVGVSGEAFNLGTGAGHSIGELVELAIKVSGSPLKPFFDPQRHRKTDILELVVDNRAARAKLGWAPNVGLEEGLRRTWAATEA